MIPYVTKRETTRYYVSPNGSTKSPTKYSFQKKTELQSDQASKSNYHFIGKTWTEEHVQL